MRLCYLYISVQKFRRFKVWLTEYGDNCGEWVESMGVVIRTWVWLECIGVVDRRYIDFLIIINFPYILHLY